MSTDVTHRWRDPGLPVARLLGLVRSAGFWLAVALPLAYVPLVLLAPETVGDPRLLATIVGGNLAALVIGHGHEPSLGAFDRTG